jgi:hypothetical protein
MSAQHNQATPFRSISPSGPNYHLRVVVARLPHAAVALACVLPLGEYPAAIRMARHTRPM